MCKRCIIFTYDEVLDIVMKLEVGVPLNFNPDWPVRTTEAYPKSVAPLIVPSFDTATQSSTSMTAPFDALSPAFTPGSLGVRELSWGFEESWKPGVVSNTRIESAAKPTWQESMLHRRCILPVPAIFETHREETYPSPKTGKPIKRQYEFRIPGQSTLFIGCIWREGTFSMVTTEARRAATLVRARLPTACRPIGYSTRSTTCLIPCKSEECLKT